MTVSFSRTVMILSYFCWHSLTRLWQMWAYISKVIGKGLPVTHHDYHSGGEEVYLYSFLTLALDRGGWPMSHPHHFTSAKVPLYLLCRRLGGSRGQTGQVQTRENLLLSLGFEPQTVQSLYRLCCPGP